MFITSSPTLLPSVSPITSAPTTRPSFVGLVVSVDISTTTTGSIDEEEISELESLVAQSYGVDIEDVSSVTEYITTGSLAITIPDNVTEDEALKDLTAALSSTLGISEDNISLTLDPETGEVSYTVTTSDYDETNTALSQLQDENIVENIETNVVVIDSIQPSGEVIAEVNVVVNADEVEVSLQQAENQIDALLDNNYSSDVSAPSVIPSLTPSSVPSSTMPSAVPTITGAVVFVDMNKLVTTSLTDDEIIEIVNEAENTFGVYPGDVEVEVTYDITGSVSIETDGSEVSEEELVSALQDSIANTLNVHPSDVSVSINSETGIVTYTISSSSAEEALNLQAALQDSTISNTIGSTISDEIPAITDVTSISFLYTFCR